MKFLTTTLRTGVPFALLMGTYFSFMTRPAIGIPFGLISGLLFGAALAAFVSFQRRRFQKDRPDFDGEELLHEGPANHFFRGEGVGGWLYLTSRRLLFRSHPVNLQPHETELPLMEITSAAPSLTAGIVPNGLLVATASGATERFVVEG